MWRWLSSHTPTEWLISNFLLPLTASLPLLLPPCLCSPYHCPASLQRWMFFTHLSLVSCASNVSQSLHELSYLSSVILLEIVLFVSSLKENGWLCKRLASLPVLFSWTSLYCILPFVVVLSNLESGIVQIFKYEQPDAAFLLLSLL